MKVIDAKVVAVYLVTTDEEDFDEYIRFAPDNWMVTMGCSDEPASSSREERIEAAFQEYLKSNHLK